MDSGGPPGPSGLPPSGMKPEGGDDSNSSSDEMEAPSASAPWYSRILKRKRHDSNSSVGSDVSGASLIHEKKKKTPNLLRRTIDRLSDRLSTSSMSDSSPSPSPTVKERPVKVYECRVLSTQEIRQDVDTLIERTEKAEKEKSDGREAIGAFVHQLGTYRKECLEPVSEYEHLETIWENLSMVETLHGHEEPEPMSAIQGSSNQNKKTKQDIHQANENIKSTISFSLKLSKNIEIKEAVAGIPYPTPFESENKDDYDERVRLFHQYMETKVADMVAALEESGDCQTINRIKSVVTRAYSSQSEKLISIWPGVAERDDKNDFIKKKIGTDEFGHVMFINRLKELTGEKKSEYVYAHCDFDHSDGERLMKLLAIRSTKQLSEHSINFLITTMIDAIVSNSDFGDQSVERIVGRNHASKLAAKRARIDFISGYRSKHSRRINFPKVMSKTSRVFASSGDMRFQLKVLQAYLELVPELHSSKQVTKLHEMVTEAVETRDENNKTKETVSINKAAVNVFKKVSELSDALLDGELKMYLRRWPDFGRPKNIQAQLGQALECWKPDFSQLEMKDKLNELSEYLHTVESANPEEVDSLKVVVDKAVDIQGEDRLETALMLGGHIGRILKIIGHLPDGKLKASLAKWPNLPLEKFSP